MDETVVVAIIALIGGGLTVGISSYAQSRLAKASSRGEAEAILAKYREPLVAAAYELQGRLYNIVELHFLRKYYVGGDEARKTYALENTLYVVAQYFGWSEILRREIQFLSFSNSKRTRAVNDRQHAIVQLFQSDDPLLGTQFLIWRGEQRAIGELMIATGDGPAQCLGYASFLERRDPSFRRWFARLEADIADAAGEVGPRVAALQHALVDLIRELDPQHVRYPDEVLRKV